MIPPEGVTFAYVRAFVDELARSGVRHVCIAPGSRSTPLALLVARHPRLRTWMHVDERSAAFFALGMARASASPVALLCTSGTAAANFLPAIVEAHMAGVPLVVLTADRPPELRDVSAPQTIDQNRLFGSYAKWFVDVALPAADALPPLLRYVRALGCRAVATAAAAPAGVVHLNFPFREPLVPVEAAPPADLAADDARAWHGREDSAPWIHVTHAIAEPHAGDIERVATMLRRARRPLVVCGPQHDPQLAAPLTALASALRAPLLADPLSQVRWGPFDRAAIVDGYDALLRHDTAARELQPDVVLRMGAPPTGKVLQRYLHAHAAARQIVVDAARWPDPSHSAAELVRGDPARCAERLLAALGVGGDAASDWLPRWCHANATARAALRAFCEEVDEPFEGRALAEVAALLPNGATLVVSSSMPVRDLDSFATGDERALRVLANRGANGIDGVVSTALGAAAAARESGGGSGPVVLVIGDLAFYHDMNGLLAARQHGLDLTIVVLNNDGGGIFSFLPQAAHGEHFEQLFGTPHGLDFQPAAAMYGANYTLAASWQAFREAVTQGVADGGLHVVEMRTDRARNVALHRAAWSAVAGQLGGSPAASSPTA